MNQQSSALLRVSEAANYLGISTAALRRAANAGRLAFVQYPSGQKRYRLEDLAAYLAVQRRT